MPVHVIGDGFGERPGDPELGQLAGPPVMHRLALVDALVPAVGRDRLHLPSPIRLDGDAARFRAAGQPPHEVQPAQVLFHLGRRPVGVAGPDQVQQATP